MEQFKYFILIILFCLMTACKTLSPVVIEPYPEIELEEDITQDDFLKKTAEYAQKQRKYIEDLINEIINKVPYVDLR